MEDRGGPVLEVFNEFVAGQLLGEEPVVRLVAVQRVDDVIAIPPGIGEMPVVFVAFALGVADDVEPVLSPAFTVLRARQQSFDDLLERGRRGVGEKCFNVFFARCFTN
jgi:hypothetical protein